MGRSSRPGDTGDAAASREHVLSSPPLGNLTNRSDKPGLDPPVGSKSDILRNNSYREINDLTDSVISSDRTNGIDQDGHGREIAGKALGVASGHSYGDAISSSGDRCVGQLTNDRTDAGQASGDQSTTLSSGNRELVISDPEPSQTAVDRSGYQLTKDDDRGLRNTMANMHPSTGKRLVNRM